MSMPPFSVRQAHTHAPSPSLYWMALCGVLLGLSAPGWNVWWLAWLALIPALCWIEKQGSRSRVVLGGFWFGFFFQGLYCLWFFDLHPLTWLGFDTLSSRLITLAGWLLIASEGGIITSLILLGYRHLKPGFQRILALPILWLLGFSLLSSTPLALPWGLLEYTQSSLWPMRFIASQLTGSGLCALMVGVQALGAHLWQTTPDIHPNRYRWQLLAVGIGLLACVGLSASRPSPTWLTPLWRTQPWPLPVLVAQGNIPIEVIRSGQLSPALIQERYIHPIEQLPTLPPRTLLIYPEEGIVPGWVPILAPFKNPALAQLSRLSQQKGIYIATGVSSISPNGQHYNSIVLLSPQPQAPRFYHKRHLVPFGESTPYGLDTQLTQALSTFGIDYSTPFQAGSAAQPFTIGHSRIGALLCFELIDSQFAFAYRAAHTQLLINASNLGWFHQNPWIEAQFLAIGQMRAAETHQPLVIASNTGISAIVSAQGEIVAQTQPVHSIATDSHFFSHKTQIIFYNGRRGRTLTP